MHADEVIAAQMTAPSDPSVAPPLGSGVRAVQPACQQESSAGSSASPVVLESSLQQLVQRMLADELIDISPWLAYLGVTRVSQLLTYTAAELRGELASATSCVARSS